MHTEKRYSDSGIIGKEQWPETYLLTSTRASFEFEVLSCLSCERKSHLHAMMSKLYVRVYWILGNIENSYFLGDFA